MQTHSKLFSRVNQISTLYAVYVLGGRKWKMMFHEWKLRHRRAENISSLAVDLSCVGYITAREHQLSTRQKKWEIAKRACLCGPHNNVINGLVKLTCEKYLTIYLECSTLHDHITTLALHTRTILRPSNIRRRRASCTAWQQGDTAFRERLIWWADLNDWGWNIVNWYDL